MFVLPQDGRVHPDDAALQVPQLHGAHHRPPPQHRHGLRSNHGENQPSQSVVDGLEADHRE